MRPEHPSYMHFSLCTEPVFLKQGDQSQAATYLLVTIIVEYLLLIHAACS